MYIGDELQVYKRALMCMVSSTCENEICSNIQCVLVKL